MLHIVNVVALANVGQGADLRSAALSTHGKLGPRIFPSLSSKCKNPPSTNCFFKSGQLLNTGSVNVISALLGATKFTDRVARDLDYDLRIINFEVQNIVGAYTLPFKLNLILMLQDGEFTNDRKYEPSLFPGLKLETCHKDISFIFFKSGAIIATGMPSIDRLLVAGQLLFDLDLERYRLGSEYRTPDYNLVREPSSMLTTPNASKRTAKKKQTMDGATLSNVDVKPHQFKVINHTRKLAANQATKRRISLGYSSSSDKGRDHSQREAKKPRTSHTARSMTLYPQAVPK